MILNCTPELPDESGSGLIYVIYLSLLFGILVAIVIAARLVERRAFATAITLEQTRYVAEAGIVMAINDSTLNYSFPTVKKYDWIGHEIEVQSEPFGAYLRWVSSTTNSIHQCSSNAYIGTDPHDIVDMAIHLSDVDKRLFVTGSTTVIGDVVLRGGSLERGSLGGKSFRGQLSGDVITDGSPDTFQFGQSVHVYITRLDSLLRSDGSSGVSSPRNSKEAFQYFSSTDITLTDTGWIPDGSVVATAGVLKLSHGVESNFTIYYGRDGVDISGSRTAGGQFFSRRYISIADSSHVPFPSIAFVSGDPKTAQIRIDSTSVFDGTLAYHAYDLPEASQIANVAVSRGAIVRGAIINDAATSISGTLFGTVATRSFFFYESPSTYVNWLQDARIDVYKRPAWFTTGMLQDVSLATVQSQTSCKRI
ncbi:MAG: hypothetical protein HKN43_10765 [Rhodothermales bacterium]|nr:hypothetical protein [Rhodothermales bacterium]